jgi:acyl transferase domain-containing protein/acyl carrier protein
MEPIAITGIGCKLPGGIRTPAELWTKLLAGADLISETPPDRWNIDSYFHPNRNVPGRTYAKWGGYVTEAAEFDAAFFGLTPREANRIDPQQRWILETAWDAIQDAGCTTNSLSGSETGVYVGISSCDYEDIQKRGRYDADMHTSTGQALSIASNRVSYCFDLRGPSLSVDTACSSALVALDLACRAIWRGEIPQALVGGVNAILQADVSVAFSKAGMLSPTGRCRAFDASADGFVRAEGAGMVMLKPLSQALRDGDRIYACIRATQTNQDGRTGGLTVPSSEQQAAMLEAAYRMAEVPPEQLGFMEAHGTGTAVGDPIELSAIGRVLGLKRSKSNPLVVGSVKSNLGHLEPASGIAGLIKLALSLQHGTIPPNVHFTQPNPRIPFDEYRLRVPTAAEAMKAHGDLRFGGVNSFGFGGTNAHAVLSSAPAAKPQTGSPSAAPAIWTVSARSSNALEESVRADAELLDSLPAEQLPALAAAVQQRRSHHSNRVAVVASSPLDIAKTLRAGAGAPGYFTGQLGTSAPPVAVVFTGQGTQWPGMARDLFQLNPAFKATVEELDAIMRPHWGRSVVDDILRGDDSVFRSDIGQGILFVLQVGVYRLFRDAGLQPVLVFGHSIGEAAAAYASGALDIEDAVRVIVERARVQEMTRGSGAMAAVGISEEAAQPLLAEHAGHLWIAAVNSPTDLTLAGDEANVKAAVESLTKNGTFARMLPFPYAFHSPKMDVCYDSFMPSVKHIQPKATTIPYISTVSGREQPGESLDPDYWWRNLREPVSFLPAVKRAAELGAKLFLEIGPHPGLFRYIHQSLGGNAAVVATLKRKEDALRNLAESTAALHVNGVKLDWRAIGGGAAPYVELPRHPRHAVTCWNEGEESRRRLTAPTHVLLGLREPGPAKVWEACITSDQFPYLADHGFRGRAVFPAAGHIELMLAAVAEGSFANPIGLSDINFDRILWADAPHVVRTNFDPVSRRLSVSAKPLSNEGAAWEQCSRSVKWAVDDSGHLPDQSLVRPEAAVAILPEDMYARFERGGNHYGPQFRTIRKMETANGELWAEVQLHDDSAADADRYYMHPALLDGVFQSVLAITPVDEERESMFLPVRIERLEWRRRAGTKVVCHIRKLNVQDVKWFADIDVFAPDGEWIATLEGCCVVKKPQESHVAKSATKLYREEWRPVPKPVGEATPPAAWLVIDPANAAGEVTRLLNASKEPLAEFVKKENGAVVVWLPTVAGEPSVSAVANAVEPLLKTAQALADATTSLWLVTSGAVLHGSPNLVQAPVAGLLRTVATELPKVRCRLLDLDPAAPEDHLETALAEFWSNPPEDEIAYRNGERLANQLVPASADGIPFRPVPKLEQADAAYELRTTEPGSLDGLAWVEVNDVPPAAHEIEIDVRAVGINFRDVLKALDIYPLAPTEPRSFGDEVSGVVRRVGASVKEFKPGDEVVAISSHGFGNRIRVASVLAAKKPANLSFEQAATVPIAFLTADYCLDDVARIERGESVLIHAAAGGVGQAAIQLAKRAGAEIFGTASPEKHEFLKKQGVKHVFHSRNLSFADGVRKATRGRGVDVVINSLAGEFIPRTLELLASGGRFVEIGKKDLFQNTPLDLNPFRSSVSFTAVDLAKLVARKPEWIGKRLRALMELFANGELQPLEAAMYPAEKLQDAFRLMAQGKHRGKLVIAMTGVPAVLAHQRPLVRSDASYLVTGGLSGLGLRTAEWLADQGAKHLVLAGRSGAKTDAAKQSLAKLAQRGVQVNVAAVDVSDAAAVAKLVQCISPPLKGAVHSAMVLQDEPLPKVTRASLETVLTPKVAGAWNLHLATKTLPLDWFVMYSSVATQFGSAAQASYVAANRFLDALATLRKAKGLPALAVNWGPLAEVGIVADNTALARYLESLGLELVPTADVFQFLKFLIRRDAAVLGAVRANWDRFRENNATAKKAHRFAPVLERKAGADGTAGGSDALEALLALPADDRASFLITHLRHSLAAVLRADEATLDPATPLTTFGVDSLMAFEFKLRIDRDFRTNVPIDKLSAGTTLTELAMLLVKQLDSAAPTTEKPAPAPAPAAVEPAGTPVIHAEPVGDSAFLRVQTRATANGTFDNLTFDSAALLYMPDRVNTVGGVADEAISAVFGTEPFVSHLYEMPLGRIGVITLPIRGREMFGSPRVPGLVTKAVELARKKGAKCVSLTGLIPSATDYGLAVREWVGDQSPRITTGHATTTAAVILNLQSMLESTGRATTREHLAVLGLGSIGQGCLALALDVLPHPRSLILCDVYAKKDELAGLAKQIKDRHGFRGPVKVLTSERGLPDGLFEATTILTAVSVPDVIDVSRLRPGTIIVDDSYPPGFSLERGIQRAEADADLFFGNAGMVRLPAPIRETVFLPPGAEAVVARLGDAAFRKELSRDPRELTACILSSLLTDRHEGFRATLGLADLSDLRSHYRGLQRMGITAARPQCGTYFMPDDVVRRFRENHAAPQGAKLTSGS